MHGIGELHVPRNVSVHLHGVKHKGHSAKSLKNTSGMPDKRKRLIQELPVRVSLMVGVWAGWRTWSGGGPMEGGGAGGYTRTQLACLKTPQQFLVIATQPLLLVALLLHVDLQVGVMFGELPEQEEGKVKT